MRTDPYSALLSRACCARHALLLSHHAPRAARACCTLTCLTFANCTRPAIHVSHPCLLFRPTRSDSSRARLFSRRQSPSRAARTPQSIYLTPARNLFPGGTGRKIALAAVTRSACRSSLHAHRNPFVSPVPLRQDLRRSPRRQAAFPFPRPMYSPRGFRNPTLEERRLALTAASADCTCFLRLSYVDNLEHSFALTTLVAKFTSAALAVIFVTVVPSLSCYLSRIRRFSRTASSCCVWIIRR